MIDESSGANLRVAIFSEVYWPMVSGVGVTLLRLADALVARGIGVRVYTANYRLPGGVDRPEVHRSASLPFFLYPDVQWAFPRHRALVADARAFRPDVVHVATEFALGLAGIRVARDLGLPVVASAHTDYEQYAARYHVDWAVRPGWRYLRWFYGQAERVLCPSRIYEEHLQSRGIRRTGVWSRGVDTAAFNPAWRDDAYRAGIGAEPGDPVVTYVGRLAREKNLDLLLEAWERVALRHPRARLALVGRGPLEREIRERSIPGVHLAGLLSGSALSAAYASADIFAFPSVTETFGNVLLEAMASGLPSIVAAAGGVLEFTEHGMNGWLVEPNSVEAIAGALDRLLTDPALRQRIAANALATAAARRWDLIDDQLIAEYRRVVRAGRIHRAA
ncbi:MAG: glycosyltransferase family 4 protein [Gemmatimonadota bacterium]